MKVILLLTVNRSHERHVERWFTVDEREYKVVAPQDIRQLVGFRPDIIIEMPEWFMNKTSEFCERVEMMKDEIRKRK